MQVYVPIDPIGSDIQKDREDRKPTAAMRWRHIGAGRIILEQLWVSDIEKDGVFSVESKWIPVCSGG